MPQVLIVMEFLDAPLYDDDLAKLAFRFVHDLVFLALVVRYALVPNSREREFVFTAVVLNVIVFFICFTMKKLDLGLGMALGLFAIFGVLRYRTDAIRTKEMTYLFVVIGLAVINALSNKKTSYLELLAVNFAIVGVVMLKERYLSRGPASEKPEKNGKKSKPAKESKVTVDYDNLELLAPERRPALVDDLRRRTGIEATRVEVENIDLRTGSARVAMWFEVPTKQ
jgi:hypothetical protein